MVIRRFADELSRREKGDGDHRIKRLRARQFGQVYLVEFLRREAEVGFGESRRTLWGKQKFWRSSSGN